MSTKQPEARAPTSEHPVRSGFTGHCPRCGKGKLFDGYLELAKTCTHCGLDNDYVDAADGPAVFVVLFAGFLIVLMALLVEIYYMPPYWVHAALWAPLAIIIPLGMLRPLKGALVGVQYKNSAKEARFDKDGTKS
ncbi:MAG: DUF983 domain-containing protein [Hyphomicrobiaceae bacterium]|nr:DUF983 domain-containing protein [Hyphomicrobiaceae bacterium]